MTRLLALVLVFISFLSKADETSINDLSRERTIPIEITLPKNSEKCSESNQCPVVFLSAGYGVPHTKYQFLTEAFVNLGYLVVAIRHELPNDPPLSVTEPLIKTRAENWQRGAETLKTVRRQLQIQFTHYDFNHLVLAGHSNGGDISAWFTRENEAVVHKIITLDHRRVALPRKEKIKVLSVRASDFEADTGVLPTLTEQAKFGDCIIEVPESRHNDMSDYGPDWLKTSIHQTVTNWLVRDSCQ